MPATYTRRFTIEGVKPKYNKNQNAECIPVKLPNSVTYTKGTILCEVKGVNEVVTITINATGGTFTATFGGQTTSALAYNATAAVVQAALEALSSIGTGNVSVTLATSIYTITFINDLGYQDVGAVTTNAASLTGGAGTAAVAVATAGVAGTAGQWKKYAASSTDGSQTGPCLILEYDCATDSSGNITLGGASGGGSNGETVQSVSAWRNGDFLCSDVPDMTDALLTLFGGRMVHGSIYANGVFRLP